MKIQGLFSVFSQVARGLTREVNRLETVSENIANAGQVAGIGEALYHRKSVDLRPERQPFQSLLEAKTLGLRRTKRNHLLGFGARTGVEESWPEAKTRIHPDERLVYDPTHPKADAQGYIRTPDINVVQEMVNLISSTRSYEANATVLTAAKQIAKRTLEI